MELGEKLKTARLEAGLSQRQLCGEIITRNMLSQIENGSAKPSYSTLQALCSRLGKPVSYFWEEAPSENLSLLQKAQQAEPADALQLLKGYLSPDPALDGLRDLITVKNLLILAENAIKEQRNGYAAELLQQAETACSGLAEPYRKQLILLRHLLGKDTAEELVKQLPDNTAEQLLRAQAALDAGDPDKALAFLDCADSHPVKWYLLRGDALMQKKEYAQAAQCYSQVKNTQVYSRLEICYRELGDYEKAYYYACKQR